MFSRCQAGAFIARAERMRLAATSLLALLGGCLAYVHSPPGRSFPLESPKTLYERETGIQLEAGGGIGTGVGLPGFTARVRHGIVDTLDVHAELNYQRIRTQDFDLASPDRNIFTGRAGLKYAPIEHIAFTAGLAAGGWGGGPFLSPDLKLILGYENRFVVPFVDVGGYTSHPARADVLVITDRFPGSLGDDTLMAAPVFTYGWTVALGLRIPLRHVAEQTRKTQPSLLLGTRFRAAYFDPEYDDYGRDGRIYWYGSVAFELVIAPRHAR